MKTPGISEIKKELSALPLKEVIELCLRLTRSKKENKELMSYLLFQAHDEQGYVESVKMEIDENLRELPLNNLYLLKKSLRRILRYIAKCSKHAASKQAEVEMLLHFCNSIKILHIPIDRNSALTKLYQQQVKKLGLLTELLHEDLRYDYGRQIKAL